MTIALALLAVLVLCPVAAKATSTETEPPFEVLMKIGGQRTGEGASGAESCIAEWVIRWKEVPGAETYTVKWHQDETLNTRTGPPSEFPRLYTEAPEDEALDAPPGYLELAPAGGKEIVDESAENTKPIAWQCYEDQKETEEAEQPYPVTVIAKGKLEPTEKEKEEAATREREAKEKAEREKNAKSEEEAKAKAEKELREAKEKAEAKSTEALELAEFTSLEECPAATTPVDTISDPRPPPSASSASATHAHAARAEEPTTPNPFCPYRKKYTEAEKRALEEWRLYYSLAEKDATRGIAVFTAIGTSGLLSPDPTVTKLVAVVAGGAVVLGTWTAADYGEKATLIEKLLKDPLDSNWRTIAAPAPVHTSGLPHIAGLKRAQQSAIDNYVAAMADDIANNRCQSDAMNRASTALVHHDPAVAASQYAAGSKCAAANGRIAGRLAKLAHNAIGSLTTALAAFRQSHVKAGLKRYLHTYESSPKLREQAALRVLKNLERVVSPAPTFEAGLRAAIEAPVTVNAALGLTLPKNLAAKVTTVDWRALEEQAGQVLGAASK